MVRLSIQITSERAEPPCCEYCGGKITEPEFVEISATEYGVPLHRNCVVAFATRILNEFDKL